MMVRITDGKDNAELLEEMRQMRQLIERLEARVNQLEAEKSAASVKPALSAAEAPNAVAATPSATFTSEQTSALSEGDRKAFDFFRGATISGTVDGYYGYNFNRPVGRVNLLRAYEDDFNYSRAYFFNYLPFCHFGLRAKYPVNEKLAVLYHVMNGAQQSDRSREADFMCSTLM
jgi:hypothetical protein